MLQNGIESDLSNKIVDWDGLRNTHFIKVKIEDRNKKKPKTKFFYIHRVTK